MKLFLTINSGTLAGQTYDLEAGFLTVGRGEMCSVRLDPITERIASKQHAFIEARFDGYYLTDNHSTNGTFLNGEKVSSAKLRSGDVIQFGRNGVTATASIQDMVPPSVSTHEAPAKEAFRDLQIEQFNKLAESEPVDLQSSLSGIGLGRVDPRPQPQPKRTGLYIAIGLLILIIPILITIVALIMLQNVGLAPAVLATVIAFIPAMLYLLPLIWLDRYDPEPLWLLALAFTWGALVAVIVSYIVNTVFGIVIYTGTGSAGAANLASAILSAR